MSRDNTVTVKMEGSQWNRKNRVPLYVCNDGKVNNFDDPYSILEKHDDYTRDIRVKYIPAWISGGIFWPTANFFNFK